MAVLTVLTLLFLTGLFQQLPEATLAAVVIAAVIELVDIASLRRLFGVWTARLGSIDGFAARADFAAAIAALLGVLIFDTLPGLIIDITAATMLVGLADTLHRQGIELRIARDIGQFRDVIGRVVPEAFHDRAYPTIDTAIAGSDQPP